MKPNLKVANLTSLNFSTHCIIPNDIKEIIENTSIVVSNTYRFFDMYTKNRATHHCILTIGLPDKDTGESFINFEYVVKKRTYIPKVIPRIDNIIDKLCELNEKKRFLCSAHLQFRKKDNRQFVINLPIKISEFPNIPISVIDGFSFAGKIKNLSYSSLVWTEKRDAPFEMSQVFGNDYSFNVDLAQNVMHDVSRIANSLLPSSKELKK